MAANINYSFLKQNIYESTCIAIDNNPNLTWSGLAKVTQASIHSILFRQGNITIETLDRILEYTDYDIIDFLNLKKGE